MGRDANKERCLFFIPLLFFFLIIASCGHVNINPKNLIGYWHWVDNIRGENSLSELAVLYRFKRNGETTYTGSGTIVAGKSRADFRIEGRSLWKIENGYFYEKDYFNKITKVWGDKPAVDIVKQVYGKIKKEKVWTRMNILKIDGKILIIEADGTTMELRKVY